MMIFLSLSGLEREIQVDESAVVVYLGPARLDVIQPNWKLLFRNEHELPSSLAMLPLK